MVFISGLHPSRKRLAAWLDEPDDAVTDHVERCERCAGRLEALAERDTGLDAELAAVLRADYQPPAGMGDRVLRSIEDRRRADREMNLLLGMFSIPTDAAGLMLPDDPAVDTRARRDQWEDES